MIIATDKYAYPISALPGVGIIDVIPITYNLEVFIIILILNFYYLHILQSSDPEEGIYKSDRRQDKRQCQSRTKSSSELI